MIRIHTHIYIRVNIYVCLNQVLKLNIYDLNSPEREQICINRTFCLSDTVFNDQTFSTRNYLI